MFFLADDGQQTKTKQKYYRSLGLSGVARYSSKQPEPRGGGKLFSPGDFRERVGDCRFRGCLFLFFSPHYTNNYTLFHIVRAMRFLQKVPSLWLLPPFLTGNNTQHAHTQHESIHTPLSQPTLPSHPTHPSPTAALDGDGGKHTASLDMSHHTVWCRHFHIPAVIFRQTRNSCTRQERRQQRAFAIGNRGCASLSRVQFSLLVTARRLCPPRTIHNHTSTLPGTPNTRREQLKKQEKTREPHCSSFCCSL
jgi:hypothetical protein